MIKTSKTYIAFPPGETVKELLEDRGMSVAELSEKLNMPADQLCRLIEGDLPLLPETAEALEKAFGPSAAFWNNLERDYRETLIKVYYENKAASTSYTGRVTPGKPVGSLA